MSAEQSPAASVIDCRTVKTLLEVKLPMKTLLLLLATAYPLLACFIPPAKDVLLFRRDALRIDEQRQKLLAEDLIALANRPSALADPIEQRATAQLLALASNLSPQSDAALSTIKRLTAPTEVATEAPAVEDHDASLKNISQIAHYLLADPQQREHFAVAQLLLDPLATIAPNLEVINARPSTKGSPRWHRAVAPLASFIAKRLPPPPVTKDPLVNDPGATPATPEKPLPPTAPPTPTAPAFPQVADFKGSILVPAFIEKSADGNAVAQAVAQVVAQAEPKVEASLSTLVFNAKLKENSGKITRPLTPGSNSSREVIQRIEANLKRDYDPNLLKGIEGTFRTGNNKYSDRNDITLALPMTILTEGLLSERKPIKNLAVLGILTSEGKIKAPQRPWQFLEILLNDNKEKKKKTPGRLLIASEMKSLLVAFLIQQREEFFFDFDVFAVSTLDEAYELAFENSAPEKTTQALSQFQEIRQVRAGKTTSSFVTNPHVLARLTAIQKSEPRYLSATLLKIKGTKSHPQSYSTETLATILQSALIPLSKAPYASSYSLKSDALTTIHEECREKLDPLANNISFGDRETYNDALNLTNKFRSLARAKSRHEKESYDEGRLSIFNNGFKAIKEEYYEFAKKTAIILGQEPPAKPPSASDN